MPYTLSHLAHLGAGTGRADAAQPAGGQGLAPCSHRRQGECRGHGRRPVQPPPRLPRPLPGPSHAALTAPAASAAAAERQRHAQQRCRKGACTAGHATQRQRRQCVGASIRPTALPHIWGCGHHPTAGSARAAGGVWSGGSGDAPQPAGFEGQLRSCGQFEPGPAGPG